MASKKRAVSKSKTTRSSGKKKAVKKAVKKSVKKTVKKAIKKVANRQKKSSLARISVKASLKSEESKVKGSKKRPSKKETEILRNMLLEMRESLTAQINQLKGDSLIRNDSVVSEEDGTDTFERQFALSIVSTDNDAVFEIDEALRRINAKTYGLCEECGFSIEPMRLKALPFVRLCIKCQSEKERNGNGGAGSGNRRW